MLASSSILYVDSGEILSTLLKMPLSSPALGSLLSNSTPALSAVTTAAQALVDSGRGACWRARDQPEPDTALRHSLNQEPRPTVPPTSPKGGTTPAPGFTPDTDVHILDRIAVLYRYRRIAIAVFVLTTAAMMIQGYTTIQYTRAQGQLLIENERSTAVPGLAGPNTEQFYEDPEPYFQTQSKILKGPRPHAPRGQASRS